MHEKAADDATFRENNANVDARLLCRQRSRCNRRGIPRSQIAFLLVSAHMLPHHDHVYAILYMMNEHGLQGMA